MLTKWSFIKVQTIPKQNAKFTIRNVKYTSNVKLTEKVYNLQEEVCHKEVKYLCCHTVFFTVAYRI